MSTTGGSPTRHTTLEVGSAERRQAGNVDVKVAHEDGGLHDAVPGQAEAWEKLVNHIYPIRKGLDAVPPQIGSVLRWNVPVI